MEGLRRLYRDRRKNRRSNKSHTPMVHLYFFSYARFTIDRLYGARLLDQYEGIYPDAQEKPC